jgi:hypothetical protein
MRGPLLAAFVLITIVAVVFGVFAIGSMLRAPEPLDVAFPATPSALPSDGASPSPSPTPGTEPRRKVDGRFRFLERVGGVPVRWDPCQTITYAINADDADSPIAPDLRRALQRVTEVTGIRFESVGTTREGFLHAYQRMRFARVIRRAELILIWVDHDDYREILRRLHDPRPSIAFAKTMKGLYANRDQYFGGIIVMDDDATSVRGFGSTYAHGAVLLHELGHIMGLDHVKDPDQLMYSGRNPRWNLHDFGPGDLEGLRLLGEDAGCLD